MKHYEDLIDRLRTATKLPMLQALMNEAADAIEELSKRVDESIPKGDAEIIIEELRKPRWIPVNERLPDEQQFVLAWKDEKPKGFVCISFWKDNAGWAFKNITHWMPLPQPPKEEAG